MIRSTVARIDLDALRGNLLAIRAFLDIGVRQPPSRRSLNSSEASAPRTPSAPPRIVAVVKANAYGHGAGPVALALEAAGADLLACADIEEAIALRTAGVRAPILVF